MQEDFTRIEFSTFYSADCPGEVETLSQPVIDGVISHVKLIRILNIIQKSKGTSSSGVKPSSDSGKSPKSLSSTSVSSSSSSTSS